MTRSQLIIQLTYFFLKYFPCSWSVPDLVLATGAPRRNVERALADMLAGKVIEREYTAYRLSYQFQNQIHAGQPVVRITTEKTLWLEKKKTSQPRTSSSRTPKPERS
jgi:hypothetical protein